MKSWLRQLKDGVVPKEFYQEFEEFKGSTNGIRNVLSKLPKSNYATLKCICQFLKKITEYSTYNKMVVTNVSIVFGPCLFRCPSDDGTDSPASMSFMSESMKTSQFVKILLENYTALFEVEEPTRTASEPVPSNPSQVSIQPLMSLPIPKSRSIDSVSSLTDPPRRPLSGKEHSQIEKLVESTISHYLHLDLENRDSKGAIEKEVVASPESQDFPNQIPLAGEAPNIETGPDRIQTTAVPESSNKEGFYRSKDAIVENGTIISKEAKSCRKSMIDELKLKLNSSNYDSDQKLSLKSPLHNSSPLLSDLPKDPIDPKSSSTASMVRSSSEKFKKIIERAEIQPPNRPPPPTPLIQTIPTPSKKQSLKKIVDIDTERDPKLLTPLMERKPDLDLRPPERPAPAPPIGGNLANSRQTLLQSGTSSPICSPKLSIIDAPLKTIQRLQPPQLKIVDPPQSMQIHDSMSSLQSKESILSSRGSMLDHSVLRSKPKAPNRQSLSPVKVKSVELLSETTTPSSPLTPLKTPLTPNMAAFQRKRVGTAITAVPPEFPATPIDTAVSLDNTYLDILISSLQNIPLEHISKDQIKEIKETFKTLQQKIHQEKTDNSNFQQDVQHYKALKRLIKSILDLFRLAETR
jgi:hypothetical protein